MDRVSLEVDHFACGESHTVTAWTTATPGLVGWYGDQDNLPCWSEDDYHAWSIQQEYTSGPDWAGIEDPDTALYLARRMGRYHDWTRPAYGSVWTEAVADLHQRGEVPIGRLAPSRRPKRDS